jgi:hypothetical protein
MFSSCKRQGSFGSRRVHRADMSTYQRSKFEQQYWPCYSTSSSTSGYVPLGLSNFANSETRLEVLQLNPQVLSLRHFPFQGYSLLGHPNRKFARKILRLAISWFDFDEAQTYAEAK